MASLPSTLGCSVRSHHVTAARERGIERARNMDGKLVLKIIYADTYKTVAFDADVTVAQAMVILKQARSRN